MRNFLTALFEIAFSFETVITIVYWGFLFEGQDDPFKLYIDFTGHLFPITALFLDFIFNPFSFNIRRYLMAIIAASLYVLINLIYTLGNEPDKPVYPILKWTDGFSYGLTVGAFAIALVCFGIGILFYQAVCKKRKLMAMIEEKSDQIFWRDFEYYQNSTIDPMDPKGSANPINY